ncbi:universal stress protein [Arthrobacter alpinus]|uniref:universal stress protein n=1 Tax=Arthrobacter alpinus TaxID=656366 RepID=UPI0009EC7CC4|nr:universal stress protein [Arthrobacter alpinus]
MAIRPESWKERVPRPAAGRGPARQRGLLGLRIGSVTASCVARARCPVLIVNDN